MKLTALAVTLSLVGSALSAVTVQTRALPTEGECVITAKYRGYHYPELTYQNYGCVELNSDCMKQIKNTTYIWNKSSCVAAAICESPSSIDLFARCSLNNPNVAEQANTPPLSSNIYKNIVGSCADQGCPMTQQNFIDFMYSTLTAINSTTYPAAEDVINIWWNPMKAWTKTGDTIPYQNFNDFLHYF